MSEGVVPIGGTALEHLMHRSKMDFYRWVLALTGTLAAATLASPAAATPEPNAKLVRCGSESCLRLTGLRETPSGIVKVNGYEVHAEGDRRWAVELPLDTVRDWSAPHARTIKVSLEDPQMQHSQTTEVDLPIGLLGDVTRLASLVISVG